MKIKAILECINSEMDNNGNRYWAFRWTSTASGKTVRGTVSGGESNISCVVRQMGLGWESVYYIRTELPKREFRTQTGDYPYAGCAPGALAAFVKRELRKRKRAE